MRINITLMLSLVRDRIAKARLPYTIEPWYNGKELNLLYKSSFAPPGGWENITEGFALPDPENASWPSVARWVDTQLSKPQINLQQA